MSEGRKEALIPAGGISGAGPARVTPAAGGGGAGVARAGLVSMGTSDTVGMESGHVRRLRRMRRGVLASARLLEGALQERGFRYRAAMVTLTYRPGAEWSPNHIAEYLKRIREWARRGAKGRKSFELRYVWVLELTQAGVPHYHVLFWLPRGVTLPKSDKRGWWPHGFTRSEWARSPVGYLVKYASKGAYWAEAQDLPPGARLWGCGGLTRAQVVTRAWHMAPRWVRDLVPAGDGVRRDKGGWWRNIATGWGYRSPWLVDVNRGVLRWIGWKPEDIDIPALSGVW